MPEARASGVFLSGWLRLGAVGMRARLLLLLTVQGFNTVDDI